jgi:hypothetical protein
LKFLEKEFKILNYWVKKGGIKLIGLPFIGTFSDFFNFLEIKF